MDEERILNRLDQLDQYLGELRQDLPEDFEEYRKQRRKYERLLHLSIETVIDVSALLLKEEGLGAPSDEESIIDKLAEAEIFDQEFVETLKDMKSFRNVLVHRYGEIDDREVYEHLERLGDFDDFRTAVTDYLSDN